MHEALQQELRRRSVTADFLGRYYTSSLVSSALVDSMDVLHPNLVLELGVGEGALASVAAHKWNKAKYVTVDADKDAGAALLGLKADASHAHHVHDALDGHLAAKIGLSLGSVDVGLCNPPFIRPQWRSSFGQILEEAGFSGCLPSIHDAGADLLFLAQNLRFLRANGQLGLILPDGLIAGERFKEVREKLIKQHNISLVVQLPRRIFRKTDAQTFLVVMSKGGGGAKDVALKRMNDAGVLSAPLNIPADLAKRRLDYAFHAASVATQFKGSMAQPRMTVGDMATDIFRGSISSNEISAAGRPVFHVTNFHGIAKERIPLVPSDFVMTAAPHEKSGAMSKYAQAGDILLARVGRNLHEKICYLPRGYSIISDCVFVLRALPENRNRLLRFFLSSQGKAVLEATSHGVGARYLSQTDVLNIALPSQSLLIGD